MAEALSEEAQRAAGALGELLPQLADGAADFAANGTFQAAVAARTLAAEFADGDAAEREVAASLRRLAASAEGATAQLRQLATVAATATDQLAGGQTETS